MWFLCAFPHIINLMSCGEWKWMNECNESFEVVIQTKQKQTKQTDQAKTANYNEDANYDSIIIFQ